MKRMQSARPDLPSLLDALYEGMLDEAAWARALNRISDQFGGATLALFSVVPSTNAVLRYDVTRNDPDAMRDYQENWIRHDPRFSAGLTCAVGEPQTERMLVDVRELRRSSFHHEFLRRWRVQYALPTWLVREPHRGVVITLANDSRHGEFTEGERDLMRALIPHLRRILEVKDRLHTANVMTQSLLAVSDRLPFATLLLDAELGIIECSRTASKLLAARDGIQADGGRLGFEHGGSARAFRDSMVCEKPLPKGSDCLVVRRRRGPPLSLLVLPVESTQTVWLGVSARWLVLVFDPLIANQPNERRTQLLLGVTPAEAALACHIAAGLSVTESARELHISRNTVRTQLKSIYSKTGTRSQAQLTRLILRGPASLA